ncbi:MAG: type II toxin-antitoxin system PemK/MazF family toxin [Clostridia bacterium]|nr:type II toxin-antitoxin system PemK/MazF family toxin [Clostridia bacterium]
MNFGANIGNEFSGMHPALILKVHIKSGDVYVIPIDSGYSKSTLEYQYDIPRIYGFKDKPRYVNLYRAQWLSVKRIDFENRVGHIDKKLLEKISDSLKKFDNRIDK